MFQFDGHIVRVKPLKVAGTCNDRVCLIRCSLAGLAPVTWNVSDGCSGKILLRLPSRDICVKRSHRGIRTNRMIGIIWEGVDSGFGTLVVGTILAANKAIIYNIDIESEIHTVT